MTVRSGLKWVQLRWRSPNPGRGGGGGGGNFHVKVTRGCNEAYAVFPPCYFSRSHCSLAAFSLGAFHYARPTSRRPVELTKGKWNDIVQKIQNFQLEQSVPFTFPPKCRLLLSEVGLETRIFENGMASFGQTTSGGGPLFLENFHLNWCIPRVQNKIKAFSLNLTAFFLKADS